MLFQAAAIGVLAVFYGCYLGKMFAQRRAGIRTDQMGVGKQGFPKWVEIIMKCATYLTVAAEVVSILANTTAFPGWVRLAGLVIAAAGDFFFVAAVLTMRDSWRAGVAPEEKTEFVSDGVFRISRNPAFLGFDLVYLGIVLMFYNPVLLALSVWAALMLHLQIVNNEEPFLQEVFGETYLTYRKQVRRYLGRRL